MEYAPYYTKPMKLKTLSLLGVVIAIGSLTRYPGSNWISTIAAFAGLFIIAKAFIAENNEKNKGQ